MGATEITVGQVPQAVVPELVAYRQGSFTCGDSTVLLAQLPQEIRHHAGGPSEATSVSAVDRELFGFVQDLARPIEFAERHEGRSQVEAKVDPLIVRRRTLWHPLERGQRLLEGCPRDVVCGPR